ncbi:MAG: fumarate hydratase [Candidatus Saccharibacteria bacterium]
MRSIKAEIIAEAAAQAAIEANTILPEDVYQAIVRARELETSPRARQILDILVENAELARRERLALCQDTGLTVIDITIGQDVHIEGSLAEALNEGVRNGYRTGHFRSSVVGHPLDRMNTGDNTPCIIHTEIVPGDEFTMTVFPKGGGSENMGRVAMLKPGAGSDGVADFVVQAVREAGGNPCPPLVVGVGIGGNMELAAYLAKKAIMRPIGQLGPNQGFEQELLAKINGLGIGPQGLGGLTTALGVNIETYPTHIASLPVAVNLGCHSTRRRTVTL